ncbi:MAG: alpha-glucosidase C-terminal domain-containing protein [Bacteroidales bacterium]|nr:alpha-glucosidase C-terminal domain-containing protein [Bacteroidales bacterium]
MTHFSELPRKNVRFLTFSVLIFTGLTLNLCSPANRPESTGQLSGMYPEWSSNSTIYEVNIRQFTPEGTFDAFRKHLPRLKSLGVEILWLMPIHPIGEINRKGTLGSYYSVKDYKAVNPEFGTMDDFKELVNEAHKMGFKIIIDWVANHTAWDHAWVTEHPEWYSHDTAGNIVSPYDWSDVADLNYESPGLAEAMIDALKFWVKEAGIDGYRCDVAGMVPTAFWEKAREELDKIKPVFMLAEAEQADHHKKAFEMSYAWELHHLYNSIARGEKKAVDLAAYFVKNDSVYGSEAYRMNFITNHDENSWNGTVKERLGDGSGTFAVLSFTLPGMPLIYSGQEAGLNKRLRFFDKDTIDWTANPEQGAFYTTLTNLKTDCPALWNGSFGGKTEFFQTGENPCLLAFGRAKDNCRLVCFANLSDKETALEFNAGSFTGDYKDVFSNEEVNLPGHYTAALPAWGYRVLRSLEK